MIKDGEKEREKENKIAENRENTRIRKFHKIRVFYMHIFQRIFSTRNLKKCY